MHDDDISSEKVIQQPPSCIEFCPADSSVFVVGTYKLEDSQVNSSNEGTTAQSRSGRVELYQIKKRTPSSDFGITQCLDIFDMPDCAALDLHFRPQEPTFFAVCTSTSQMIFFRLANVGKVCNTDPVEPSILREGSIRVDGDDEIIATSFAWYTPPILDISDDMSFVVTFSSGQVKLFEVRRGVNPTLNSHCDFRILSQASIDPGHTLEAWTVAIANLGFPTVDEKFLLTGGDDSTLALHSLKGYTHPSHAWTKPLLQDRKSHNAGVTAILPIFSGYCVSRSTQAFVTGSYDEHIRVFTFDELPPYKRKLVAELALGGGVWRLCRMSESSDKQNGGDYIFSVLILASCMHAGVRIVRVVQRPPNEKDGNDCIWEIDVVGQFTEGHESMCYGSDSIDMQNLVGNRTDYRPGTQSINQTYDYDAPRDFVVVSTSFYDKKICVWSFHDDWATIKNVNASLEAGQEVFPEGLTQQKKVIRESDQKHRARIAELLEAEADRSHGDEH